MRDFDGNYPVTLQCFDRPVGHGKAPPATRKLSESRIDRPYANMSFCRNGKATGQAGSIFIKNSFNNAHPISRTLISQAKQQYATVCLTNLVDKIAEILVVSQQHSFFVTRTDKDVPIFGLRHRLGNSKYIMTSITQLPDYCLSGGFVNHESQGKRPLCGNNQREDIFVGQRFSCIGQCRADIIRP